MKTRLLLTAPALLLLGLSAAPGALAPGALAPFHPHFPKRLECRIAEDLEVTLRYQTATFDRDGAAAMQAGQAWHLAGAGITTSADLVIGGLQVPAGAYALSARKTADDGWELTLHEGRGFSRPGEGDTVLALATELERGVERYEHLHIDVQPAGDKKHTRLYLEVRFDTLRARALIEVPAAGEDK